MDARIPKNSEAEAGYIASILLDPSQLILSVAVKDFFDERNQRIYKAILTLPNAIDQILVAQKMYEQGTLQEHDCSYLSQIISQLPTSVNGKHYASIVKDMANRRVEIQRAGDIAGAAYDGKVKTRRKGATL